MKITPQDVSTYYAMSMTEIIEIQKEVKALKEEKDKLIKAFDKILNLFEMDNQPIYLGYDEWANVFHPLNKDGTLLDEVEYDDLQVVVAYTTPQPDRVAELEDKADTLKAELASHTDYIGKLLADKARLIESIENLLNVKGRHNTEIATNRLFALLSEMKG
jgi:prefoldin subunit 5